MVNPFNAGINTVTNCINGLKNVITSQKSGGMTFFIKKVKPPVHWMPEQKKRCLGSFAV